jgi:hypothetical protein
MGLIHHHRVKSGAIHLPREIAHVVHLINLYSSLLCQPVLTVIVLAYNNA